MALTYATRNSEYTNLLSSAADLWWDRNFIPTAVKNNGILYAMALLAGGPVTSPNIGNVIRKEQRVEGNQIIVRHLGELETWNYVADADQDDTITYTLNPNAFGARMFDWAHMYYDEFLPASERAIIRGDSARTASWTEDIMKKVMESFYDKLDTDMMGVNAGSRTQVGGIRAQVDDGVVVASNGGLNRTTAGNENFQSYVATVTDLTLEDCDTMRLNVIQKGGRPAVGVSGLTPYKKLMQELRGYTLYNDDRWDKFGSIDKVGYGGVMHVYDHKGSDTDLIYLDPRACRLYLDKSLTTDGPMPVPNAKGANLIWKFDYWVQFIVAAENWCGKLKGIVS